MFTNKTQNLDLPQWVGTDKANWDVDLNYAFKQISDYVNTLNEKFSGLDSTDGQFDESIKEINRNIETINTAIDSINETDGVQTADIIGLKEKVTKLQTDVSELTTSSTDLTQRLQTIENDLPSIEQSITTLTQNYNTLAEKVETLENSGGKVITDEIITFDSSMGTSSDTITKYISSDLIGVDKSNALIEVSLAPRGITRISQAADSSVLSTGFLPLSNISSGDLLLNVRGITKGSFTQGKLNVKFKGISGPTVTIDITYSLQVAVHSFDGAPDIRVKIIKLR